MILIFVGIRKAHYKQDLLNLCCEIEGATARLSYDQQWLPSELRAGQELTGQKALLLFCEDTAVDVRHPEQAQRPLQKLVDGAPVYEDVSFQFHPLRQALIRSATTVGSAMNLELELGAFFDFRGQRGKRDFPLKFQAAVEDHNDHPNRRSPDGKRKFLRREPGFRFGADAFFCSEWRQLAAHLGGLRGLTDCTFLHAQPATLSPGRAGRRLGGLFPFAAKPVPGRTSYEVRTGRDYEVRVQQVLGADAKKTDAQLDLSPNLAVVHGPFSVQSGGGITAEFVVHFRRSFETQATFCVVRTRGTDEGQALSPQLLSRVSIQASRLFLWSAILLLAGGTLLTTLDADTIQRVLPRLHSALGPGGASAFFKVMGTLLLAGGSYLGFNKPPAEGA